MKPRYSKKRYSRKNRQRKSKKLSKQRCGGIGHWLRPKAYKEAKKAAEAARDNEIKLLNPTLPDYVNQVGEVYKKYNQQRRAQKGTLTSSDHYKELSKTDACEKAEKAKDAKYRKQLTDLLESGYYDPEFRDELMEIIRQRSNSIIISDKAKDKAKQESSDCQGRGYSSRVGRGLKRGLERGLKLGWGKKKLNKVESPPANQSPFNRASKHRGAFRRPAPHHDVPETPPPR